MAKFVPSTKTPTDASDLSANWKKFLEEQKKTDKKTTVSGASVKPGTSYANVARQVPRKTSDTNKKKRKTSPTQESETPREAETSAKPRPQKYLAIDCEFVGVGPGAYEDTLARVSIVDKDGKCVYDQFVKPIEKVTDFRTEVSGIRPLDLQNGAVLIGHSVSKDLQVLMLTHPKSMLRDTATYRPFRTIVKSYGLPSLKKLAQVILGVHIQQGEHDSITDAKIAMQLYQLHKKQWEIFHKKHMRNKIDKAIGGIKR